MEKIDGRKIDRKALEAIRIRAVQRVAAGKIYRLVLGVDPRQLKFDFVGLQVIL